MLTQKVKLSTRIYPLFQTIFILLITIVLKLDTSRLFMFITFTVFLNHLTHFLMTIVRTFVVFELTFINQLSYCQFITMLILVRRFHGFGLQLQFLRCHNLRSIVVLFLFVHYSTFKSMTSLFAKYVMKKMLQIHHQESVATKVIHNHCGVEYTETSRLKVI